MRLMEVGTKLEGAGQRKEAKEMFDKSYKLYSALLGLAFEIDKDGRFEKNPKSDGPWTHEDIVNKLVDCCKE